MEGERRVVTMLFCDVKGSTAAASQLDPEEWAELINGAFTHMIQPVYRYEGTVARLMGDGLLAFFGAPIAHEDDPQRAILAGRDIVEAIKRHRPQVRQRWGVELDVRVGINTGLVVVGAVGSDLRMEYTALGDAINLAARMEQTAQPGTVQVAEATHRLIAPLFDLDVLHDLEVKGRTEPVTAYRVLGRRTLPGRLGVVRGVAGLRSPLVARDDELASLIAAGRALSSGRGQIISVMGEAGPGQLRPVGDIRGAADRARHPARPGSGGRPHASSLRVRGGGRRCPTPRAGPFPARPWPAAGPRRGFWAKGPSAARWKTASPSACAPRTTRAASSTSTPPSPGWSAGPNPNWSAGPARCPTGRPTG